jgi:hypothetical protein
MELDGGDDEPLLDFEHATGERSWEAPSFQNGGGGYTDFSGLRFLGED